MARSEFNEKELQVKSLHKCGAVSMFKAMGMSGMPEMEPIFDRPITEKENFELFFSGQKPYWIPQAGWAYCDVNCFEPRINRDNIVGHLVLDGEPDYEYESNTMRSYFDLDWVFVPVAGGSTVQPGHPKIEDMNDWKNLITFPDLDKMDFEECGLKNKDYLDTPQLNELHILCGFWERLISLMDVEGAAVAMIDDDQEDALKEFFDCYADWLIEYIRRMKKVCDIDAVLLHDDLGHQNGAFFSLDTVMDKIVPYMKKLVDAVHELGMRFELHCCGKAESLVPAMIAAGVDLWCPQPINDIDKMAETYQNQPIAFGQQILGLPLELNDDQIRAEAKKWFEKHKNYRVIPAFMDANPVFMTELYKLSRLEYQSE